MRAALSCLTISIALLLLAGCAGTPPSAGYAPARATPSRLSSDQASDLAIHALGLVGTPYRYGGNTPDGGFDCSGLIGHVYQTRARIPAPRTVASLVGWGQPVAAGMARTGDLVVFAQGGVAMHAGIYVGDGRFVLERDGYTGLVVFAQGGAEPGLLGLSDRRSARAKDWLQGNIPCHGLKSTESN